VATITLPYIQTCTYVRPVTAVSSFIGAHEVPEAIRALTTLAEPDYVDLFTVTAPMATDASAEAWARAVLEQSPLARRHARRLWRFIGLRLGPPQSPDHVQGWKITASGDNWLRLETASWCLTGQAVFLVEEGQVSLSLSLRYDRPIAALVWRFVSGPHQRAVPVMLHQAVKLRDSQDTA
jgi:hypothetical protein